MKQYVVQALRAKREEIKYENLRGIALGLFYLYTEPELRKMSIGKMNIPNISPVIIHKAERELIFPTLKVEPNIESKGEPNTLVSPKKKPKKAE